MPSSTKSSARASCTGCGTRTPRSARKAGSRAICCPTSAASSLPPRPPPSLLGSAWPNSLA
eukprot:3147700-Prymnesium_polylepis.1